MTSDESALWPRPMTPLTPAEPEPVASEPTASGQLLADLRALELVVAILAENSKPHTKRQILKELDDMDMEDSNG